MLIQLKIAGKSSTKQRPRFNSQTGHTYTPPSNIISENDVRSVWREAGEPRFEGNTPLSLHIFIDVLRPQSHYNSKGILNKKGNEHPWPDNKKPDLDNAVKLIMDALNSRAYKDDVQICHIEVMKMWGEWPETRVTINSMLDDIQ
jgi:Holliday junction resolvase RusA-like endonuclease